MMKIMSWNIQNGIGVDGNLSLQRIADEIRLMADPDVICLQEISRGLQLQDSAGTPDQIAELQDLFPEYEIIFGVAVDASSDYNVGSRWQFGNAILSKRSVISVQHHILPKPAVSTVKHMTRQVSEVVVGYQSKSIRIASLHLEYHSLMQRIAQIRKLRDLQFEAVEESREPPKADPVGPYQTIARPVDCVYCGDFNMLYGSEEYLLMMSPTVEVAYPLHDAWKLVYGDVPHDPTCGIFDHQSWPQGPHCRDFFFVTGDCTKQVFDMRVNTKTNASDHQPLMITLKE